MERLCLFRAGRMSSIQKLVFGLVRLLLDSGKPLESKRRPFKFLNYKSIVKITTIFYPNFVLLFRAQFLFGLTYHLSQFDIYISGKLYNLILMTQFYINAIIYQNIGMRILK